MSSEAVKHTRGSMQFVPTQARSLIVENGRKSTALPWTVTLYERRRSAPKSYDLRSEGWRRKTRPLRLLPSTKDTLGQHCVAPTPRIEVPHSSGVHRSSPKTYRRDIVRRDQKLESRVPYFARHQVILAETIQLRR